MVDDSKNQESIPLSPTLDAPPSYDDTLSSSPPPGINAQTSSSSSASTGPSIPSQPPKETLHLFHGPPNAEPLLGRLDTPLEVLNSIEEKKHGLYISSHDRRLQNGSTLYDWIRHKTLSHPKYTIRCEGVHIDIPERDEVVTDRDGVRHRRKGQPERIVDFDFAIDLNSLVQHTDNYANVHLSTVLPEVPVMRGTHGVTYSPSYAVAPARGTAYEPLLGPLEPGRAASRSEVASWTAWAEWRKQKGLPPWAKQKDWPDFLDGKGKSRSEPVQAIRLGEGGEIGEEETNTGREVDLAREEGEAMLKAWCDRYASDPGMLKEFWVPYHFWGWDQAGLTTAIKGAITSTGYNSNHINVEFKTDTVGLVVRPSNLLSRLLNTTWIYVLLWITMLYPLIWIWQRFHRLGGAPYNVGRASYCLKYYPPLPSTFPNETLDQAKDRLGGMYKIHRELPRPAQLVPGPQGIHYLLGRKEGEWFREWEERIRMGVRMRYRGELQGGGEEEAGTGLDGY